MGSSMQLDHRATWDEVCEALAFSSPDAHERSPGEEVCYDVAPDSWSDVRFTAEELAWLRLAKRALDSACN
jgi:hypothetical protein